MKDDYIQGISEIKKSGTYDQFVKSKNKVDFLSKPYIEDLVLTFLGFTSFHGKILFAKETEDENFLKSIL